MKFDGNFSDDKMREMLMHLVEDHYNAAASVFKAMVDANDPGPMQPALYILRVDENDDFVTDLMIVTEWNEHHNGMMELVGFKLGEEGKRVLGVALASEAFIITPDEGWSKRDVLTVAGQAINEKIAEMRISEVKTDSSGKRYLTPPVSSSSSVIISDDEIGFAPLKYFWHGYSAGYIKAMTGINLFEPSDKDIGVSLQMMDGNSPPPNSGLSPDEWEEQVEKLVMEYAYHRAYGNEKEKDGIWGKLSALNAQKRAHELMVEKGFAKRPDSDEEVSSDYMQQYGEEEVKAYRDSMTKRFGGPVSSIVFLPEKVREFFEDELEDVEGLFGLGKDEE